MKKTSTPIFSKSLLDHFSCLQDPRQSWKTLYSLDEILLLTLCATMAGADDFTEICEWGRHKLEFLRRFLPFKRGIPAHDTINDLFNALPAEAFRDCFVAWVNTLRRDDREFVSIDGKVSRRAHAKDAGPLHIVSAWASKQRLVLGQTACAEKSNEITAIPQLLERLELAGALVTIDAAGCQTEIAAKIRSKGADYLLSLKQNWPLLFAETELFFSDPANLGEAHETLEKGHGRIERRVHHTSRDVGWIKKGGWDFPALTTLCRVVRTTERNGKTSVETHYHISSADLSPRQYALATRSHWHIENRLHWVLDVVFHDDLMRLRTGHGPQNMATIRHIGLNLLREDSEKTSMKNRRKKLGWNDDYLFQTITQTA
jgi:predicted transposase YbfD/YdcC